MENGNEIINLFRKSTLAVQTPNDSKLIGEICSLSVGKDRQLVAQAVADFSESLRTEANIEGVAYFAGVNSLPQYLKISIFSPLPLDMNISARSVRKVGLSSSELRRIVASQFPISLGYHDTESEGFLATVASLRESWKTDEERKIIVLSSFCRPSSNVEN